MPDCETLLTDRFAHLPPPDHDIECGPCSSRGDDDWRRYFLIQEWEVGRVSVIVAGEQRDDGQITRWMPGLPGSIPFDETHAVPRVCQDAQKPPRNI